MGIDIHTIKHLNPLPKHITEKIKKNGFRTGSSVFGGASDHSDIDIILLLHHTHKWQKIFTDFFFDYIIDSKYMWYPPNQYRASEFLSVYVLFKNLKQPINLLLFGHEEYFLKWKSATMAMKLLIHKFPKIKEKVSKNKQTRVELFEMLKKMV